MREQEVRYSDDPEQLRLFMKRLLNDVHALDLMIKEGHFESGVRRIGVEQELFLVDKHWQPSPVALKVLEGLSDSHYTTELAQFNLEFNLAPLSFAGECLQVLETSLNEYLDRVRTAAHELGSDVVLVGILPTLTKSDLHLRNMTPRSRYFALNRAMTRIRGEDYEFRIRGVDEVNIRHDSVMVEACNTSFQVHFQADPSNFASLYNIAQLITAPVLAAAANSPLLFGKRLWKETRIALFQQAVDTRKTSPHLRETKARVSFGSRWIQDSVLEIFKEDIARYRVLMGTGDYEDPFQVLRDGGVPTLAALCLHNSTIYRWNRPCYGVLEGKPNLRIENRVLPAGPSVVDSVSNAAFYFGLMAAISDQGINVAQEMDFADVRTNFLAAAQLGLSAQFTWLGGEVMPAQELICEKLVPLARQGLFSKGIPEGHVDRYLGILFDRVQSGMTGAQWCLKSLVGMEEDGLKGERLAALTAGMLTRQNSHRPVHEWSLAGLNEAGGWKPDYMKVEQLMTTDLVTVSENDTLDLAANLMDWERIRYIPVEDEENRLVGIISYRSVLRYFAEQAVGRSPDSTVAVTEIMKKDPLTIEPETLTLEAIEKMRQNRIGCLPVVKEGRLVGIVTERDFMELAAELLEQRFQGTE